MEWIEDPGEGEIGKPWNDDLRWSFCTRHNIWHYTDDCPACQTQWPESASGIPCTDCAHCAHGASKGVLRNSYCPHTCEPVICHDGQDCERTP